MASLPLDTTYRRGSNVTAESDLQHDKLNAVRDYLATLASWHRAQCVNVENIAEAHRRRADEIGDVVDLLSDNLVSHQCDVGNSLPSGHPVRRCIDELTRNSSPNPPESL